MSFMKWATTRKRSGVHPRTPEPVVSSTRRSLLWKLGSNGVFGSETAQPKLVVVDPNAPQQTRQSLQQLAEIVNSLLRAKVLVFTAAREYELRYEPADLQDHPIGTPDAMSVWDALDRLASRVKALE